MTTSPFFALTFVLTVAIFGSTQVTADDISQGELVKRSEVEFIPLNPLRGKSGPQSGRLWGNIRGDMPSGMLVTFADGFQSPPHIHNITYRAVVIDGAVHNDDPTAEKMWMEPGSFWTQPRGETHITAAMGKNPTIFLEILSGPYLVKPAKQAFDAGERPINIDARNVTWLNAADTSWISGDGPKMAFLWGKIAGREKNGTFVKLPPGYRGKLSTTAPLMRVVTIKGVTQVQFSGGPEKHKLDPGSYFGSKGKVAHQVSCVSENECVLYLHTEGKYQISSQ